MEVNSLFLITSKAKLPARVLHQYSSREKNEDNIRHASGQNFLWF